jgi:hypothetical protein
MKRCSVCKKRRKKFNSQGTCCVKCHNDRNTRWREANREKYRLAQVKHNRKRNGRTEYKQLQRRLQRNWYWKNHELCLLRRKQRTLKAGRAFAEFILVYLLEHPCVDCGEPDPLKLSFDHVRGTKRFNISCAGRSRSMKSVLAEIAKCDVRCHNCHAVKTARERRFLLWRLLRETDN